MATAATQQWAKGDFPSNNPDTGKARIGIKDDDSLVIQDDSGAEHVISSADLSDDIDELKNINTDTNEPQGFIRSEPDTMGDLSFSDASRVFQQSVKSSQSSFSFYSEGVKFIKTSTVSCTLDNITGLHYIYYDVNGDIQHTMTFSTEIVTTYAIVAIIYWNATSGESIIVSDERHGIQMDGMTHLNLHATDGAKYDKVIGGLNITGLSESSTGYTNISSGRVWDEDIPVDIALSTSNEFWYREGPSGEWNKTAADNLISYNGGSGNVYWNEWTGTTWQLTKTGTECHSITHFIAVPGISGGSVVKIIGQTVHPSGRKAREAILTEMGDISLGGLPTPEFVYLYSVISECTGELYTLAQGKLYVDFRLDIGAGLNGHVPGVSSHIDLTDENLMLVSPQSVPYTLQFSDRVVMVTQSGTITLPRTNTISNDGYLRMFYINNASPGEVIVQTTSPEIFSPGNNKLVLSTINDTVHIGCMYSADGTNAWMNIAAINNIAQIRRGSSWDAANFNSDTAIPFDVVDKENNNSVLSYSAVNPERITSMVHATAKLSYWVGIDSTGGSTYNLVTFIRKNGVTEIPGTRCITGNYGGEDQSCSIGTIYDDTVIGDYYEVVFNHSNLTGNITSCTFIVSIVC